MPKVSVIMTPYQREKQLNVTLPTIVGADEIVIEPDDRDHSQQAWMNPAPILNRAIEKATGDIIIQQNAECMHVNSVVEMLRKVPRGQVWFASCVALKEHGDPDKFYCHPELRPVPYFFCGSYWKDEAPRWDERYIEYGMEDVQWADDARARGLEFRWLFPQDALVYHQWHPPFVGNSSSRHVYETMRGVRL